MVNDPLPARIAMLTLFTPDVADVGNISVYNKRTYCDLHGYDLIVERASLDPTRPPHWSKLLAIKTQLPKYDWVFWTDHDSLIMSFGKRLEELCDDEFDLLITDDSLGLNSGQMFLRNSPAIFKLLSLVYEQTQFIGNNFEEQAAIAHLISQHPDLLKVKRCPQRAFNSYPENYQPGDFLLHFAGTYNKLAVMQQYQAEADILIAPGETLDSFLQRFGQNQSVINSDVRNIRDDYEGLPAGGLLVGHARDLETGLQLAKTHDLTIFLSEESLNVWHCVKARPRRQMHGPAVVQHRIPRIDDVPSEMCHAAQLIKSGLLKQAEAVYRNILLAHADHAEAMHRLAWLCREQGYHHESIDLMASALKLRPGEAEWHNDLGSILSTLGLDERAADHLAKAVELRPDHPTALANLAVVRERQGRFDEAIAAYQEAFRRNRPKPERLNDFAIVLTRRGRFDEAIEVCRQALQLAPNSAESFNNMAVAMLQAGLIDEALSAFDEAIKRQPSNPDLRSNHAAALLLSKQREKRI